MKVTKLDNKKLNEEELRSNQNMHRPEDVCAHADVTYVDARDFDEKAQDNAEEVYDALEDIAKETAPKDPDDGNVKLNKNMYDTKISLDESLFEDVDDGTVDSEVAEFLEDNVAWLVEEDAGCATYKLDDRLGICVGWQDGYDSNDKNIIHSNTDPTYAIVAGIKVYTSDDMRTDYDWINYPYFANGEVVDVSVTISPDENYDELAVYFLKDYSIMADWEIEKDGLVIKSDDGEEDAVEESCKGKKRNESKNIKKTIKEQFDVQSYTTLTDDEREMVAQAADEMGVDASGFERYTIKTLKKLANAREKRVNEIKKPTNMEYDDWKKLRKEIKVGSYFSYDYENSFGLDTKIVQAIADGYVENLWDLARENSEDGEYPDEFPEELDTPDEFANYAYGIEWDEDDFDDARIEKIDNKYNDIRDNLFYAEEIYDLASDYAHDVVQQLVGESLSHKLNKKLTEAKRFKPMSLEDAKKFYNAVKDAKDLKPNDSFLRNVLDDIWKHTKGLTQDYGGVSSDEKADESCKGKKCKNESKLKKVTESLKVKVYNIDYDIEDEDVDDPSEIEEIRKSLPSSLVLELDNANHSSLDYEIADAISNKTGWLVNDFDYDIVSPKNESDSRRPRRKVNEAIQLNFDKALLDKWIDALNGKKENKDIHKTYFYTMGDKYIKVSSTYGGKYDEAVFAFVDADGNIYKPAGWRAPAKGIRARIDKNPPMDDGALYSSRYYGGNASGKAESLSPKHRREVRESKKHNLEPRKRTAPDGKVWWVAYDTDSKKYSTITTIGKYENKKDCQYAIDKYNKLNESKLTEKKGKVEGEDDNVYQLVYDALFLGNKNFRPHIADEAGNVYDWEQSLIMLPGYNDYDLGIALEKEEDGKYAKAVADKLGLKYEVKPTSSLSDGYKFIATVRIPDDIADKDATEYVTSIGLDMDTIRPKRKGKK